MQDYRLCPCGEKIPTGLKILRCPACNRPVDMTGIVIHEEESPDQGTKRAVVVQAGEPVPHRNPDPPAQKCVQNHAQQINGPSNAASTGCKVVQNHAAPTAGPGAQKKTQSEIPAEKKRGFWQLDYFGRKIRIPAKETACLGRNSVGADFFEGNPLVSRKHIYLWANGAGQLMAEDRESLNGSWYTRNGQRSPMEHGVSVRLIEGDVLWLYDLPLKVEHCNEENGMDGIS